MALQQLLTQADAQTHYDEEVSDPVTVLSTPASMGTVKATVGFVGVGLVTAAEAYLELLFFKGWGYHADCGLLFCPPPSSEQQ